MATTNIPVDKLLFHGASPLGFIMTRCMQKVQHVPLWRESYACIRRHYPDAPVLIIDDHSDPDLLFIERERDENLLVEKAAVVPSKLAKGVGELLPYFYLHTFASNLQFGTTVVLHDSMFLQRPLPAIDATETTHGFQFMFHFKSIQQNDEVHRQEGLLRALELPPVLEEQVLALRKDIKRWSGCFGAAMRIQNWLLERLVNEYGLLRLAVGATPAVRTRPDRMALERVIGVLCHHAGRCEEAQRSVVGSVFDVPCAFKFSMENYTTARKAGKLFDLPIVKVWNSR